MNYLLPQQCSIIPVSYISDELWYVDTKPEMKDTVNIRTSLVVLWQLVFIILVYVGRSKLGLGKRFPSCLFPLYWLTCWPPGSQPQGRWENTGGKSRSPHRWRRAWCWPPSPASPPASPGSTTRAWPSSAWSDERLSSSTRAQDCEIPACHPTACMLGHPGTLALLSADHQPPVNTSQRQEYSGDKLRQVSPPGYF